LNLVPLHPDRSCGLGFLGNVAIAFAPLLMAHSGLIAGYIANRILHEGAKLPDYKVELLAMAALLLASSSDRFAHSFLSSMPRGFPVTNVWPAGERIHHWLCRNGPVVRTRKASLFGIGRHSISGRFGQQFAIVTEMKLVPFNRGTVVRFIVVIALPLAPLALTMFSLEELLKRLITVFL